MLSSPINSLRYGSNGVDKYPLCIGGLWMEYKTFKTNDYALHIMEQIKQDGSPNWDDDVEKKD